MLEDSLRKLGAGRSVLVDREGRVIAGNKTVETARKLGLTKIAVIETDGETLVAVRRRDLDLKTDQRAVELAVADNRVAEIDLDWNAEVLAALDIDLSQFWDEQELAALMSEPEDGGPVSAEEAHRTLVERFGVPPFSVLDARQGYWQDRKRAWIALGIKSELGRGGGDLLGLESAEQARGRWKSSPGGSPRPAADYSKQQRGDGSGKAINEDNPPLIQEIDNLLVVRDDLLPGGTKRRALPVLMKGSPEYVYASPVYGYAQVALAHVARESGKRATVFCAKRNVRHARTLEAQAAGARIIEVPFGYLSVLKARGREYCAVTGAQLLPFGLDTPAFIEALADVARSLKVNPREVWTVAGSGVLSRALQLAWPGARFFAVQVGAVPNAGRATVIKAPERFEQDAKLQPPFPSCSNFDAKAWQFVRQRAAPGALFWNVAA